MSIRDAFLACEALMRKRIQLAAGVGLFILAPTLAMAGERRIALPHPVLMMYGYADALTGKPEFWPSSNPQESYDVGRYKAVWQETLRVFNVVDGITQDADLVKQLRQEGKVFAYHVSNRIDEHHKTVADFVSEWSQPFENTLGGKLPGGFDAICIDEFHSFPEGSPRAQLAIQALKQVREQYPDRLIFVSGVLELGDGGPGSLYGDKQTVYDDTLSAVLKYSDIFVLENYQHERNPQFQYFESLGRNIETRCPGLLKKTIFALYISQSAPFIADDDPAINFFDFLECQVDLIKIGRYSRQMPGVAYWVFYRSKPETIERVITLTKGHFK